MGRWQRAAHRFASWSDLHAGWVLTGLTAWYVALVWAGAQRPLWYDELYTFYIAQQPTATRMLQAVHKIDFNPPLNYFLTRWSIAIFGASSWATRLPAIGGFWLAGVAIFAMLRRRASCLIGAIGVLLFFSSAYFGYATEARPYGLLLGFTMLLIAAWDGTIAKKQRVGGLVLILTAGVLLLLTHLFGALSLGAVWIGEATRSWRRRQVDWLLWVVLLLPVLVFVTYGSFFHDVHITVFPPESQITAAKLWYLYFAIFRWIWRPILALLVIAWIWRNRLHRLWSEVMPAETAVVLATLFLIPVGLSLVLLRSHGAFYDRYGMAAVLPLVLLLPLLLWQQTSGEKTASVTAFGCVACLLLLSTSLRGPLERFSEGLMPPRAAKKVTGLLTQSVHGPFRAWWKPLPLPSDLLAERERAPLIASLSTFDPELPIVAASELTFVEMDHREPASVARRLFYVYDEKAELEIAQRTIAPGLLNTRMFFPYRGKMVPYATFIAEHRTFVVIGVYEHPGDWLLRKLQQDGATLEVVARNEEYSSDLYLVRFSDTEKSKGEAQASPSAQR